MKTLFLLSLMLFTIPAFGQEPSAVEPVKLAAPRAIEPVKITLALEKEPTAIDREFDGYLRGELNVLGDVAIRSSGAHFYIKTVVKPVTASGEVIGYSAAVLIVTPDGDSCSRFRLSNETGPTLPAMAKNLAQYLNKEFFDQRRGK